MAYKHRRRKTLPTAAVLAQVKAKVSIALACPMSHSLPVSFSCFFLEHHKLKDIIGELGTCQIIACTDGYELSYLGESCIMAR